MKFIFVILNVFFIDGLNYSLVLISCSNFSFLIISSFSFWWRISSYFFLSKISYFFLSSRRFCHIFSALILFCSFWRAKSSMFFLATSRSLIHFNLSSCSCWDFSSFLLSFSSTRRRKSSFSWLKENNESFWDPSSQDLFTALFW